jgi:GNAT superfamily N-acetyltransferase
MSEILTYYSPAAIARAIEANHWQFYKIYTRQPEVEAHEHGGLAWITGTLPVNYLNQVMRTNVGDYEAETQIASMLDRYRRRGVAQFVWRTWPSVQPTNLGERLLAHGFTTRPQAPSMVADLRQLPAAWPTPAGITIARVEDSASLTDWAGVVRSVYDMSEAFAAFLMRAFAAHVGNSTAAARHYLAWVDGQAVACATLFLGAGVAGIYRVATLAQWRGRGIGGAVVLAALHEARAAGYRFATLRSSEIAHHLYQQLGFGDQFSAASYLSPLLQSSSRFSPNPRWGLSS